MAEQNGNLVMAHSDEETLDTDEISNFLFSNKVIKVNTIDESSNSSTAENTQLVSLSVTNEGK